MAWMLALTREFVVLAAQLAVGNAPISALLLLGMVTALAVIAVAIAARLAALLAPDVPVAALTADVELPVRRSQSNPDADGHTRARAPGVTA